MATADVMRTTRVGTTEVNPTSVNRAILWAWVAWVTLLLVPLAALGLAIFFVLNSPATAGRTDLARGFAWGIAAYMAVAVPLMFFWRGRRFRGYWRHEPVQPRTYLLGMIGVWAALSLGGLLGAIATFVSRTLVPNSLIALVALVALMALWPKGNAMVRPVGNPGDVGTYEEPH